MGVIAYLYQANAPLVGLPDPSGGSFDAAGDFDRVLPLGDTAFPLLVHVDPHSDTEFGQATMPELISEIDQLLTIAKEEPARRGLLRLRVMAAYCEQIDNGSLIFGGD